MANAQPYNYNNYERGHSSGWRGTRGRRSRGGQRGRGRGRGDGHIHYLWRDIRRLPIKQWSPYSLPSMEVEPILIDFEVVASFNYLEDDQRKGSAIGPGVAPILNPAWNQGQLRREPEDYLATTGPVAMKLCLEMLDKYWRENKMNPVEMFPKFDIICTKRVLCRLFRLALSSISQMRTSYRIDIQRVDNVLIMDRSSHEPDSLAKYLDDFIHKKSKHIGPPPHGAFVEMIGYKLGALNLLVRSCIHAVQYQDDLSNYEDDDLSNYEDGDLSEQLATISITDTNRKRIDKPKISKLHAHCSTLTKERRYDRVDMTTVSTKYFDATDWGGKWPNMFFGNNKKLIIGPHQRGMVKEVDEISMTHIENDYLRDFGQSPKVALGKMTALLNEIFQTIMEQPTEKELYSLICKGQQIDQKVRQPMDILLYERTSGCDTEYYVPPPIQK